MRYLCMAGILLAVLTGCETPLPTLTPTLPLPTETEQPIPTITASETQTPSSTPTLTVTPGPSPTSTPLSDLLPRAWTAKPVLVEAARVETDVLSPFSYTPLFLLYGDGLLLKRSCQDGDCRYLQAQLEQAELCRLVNAIDRTGFLDADPLAYTVPVSSGAVTRFAVNVYKENSAQIPDLDRWVENPSWHDAFSGCPGCFPPPKIDPAFIALYRLLTTYPVDASTVMATDRLAIWLDKPIISGNPQAWSPELLSLAELAVLSTCPDEPNRQSAVILEGPDALSLSSFLSEKGGIVPLFTENELIFQINSRWLLPYEMPQTCFHEAGLYPPPGDLDITWRCAPEDGAIPTPTPTITPTATITPTPLR